MRSRADGLFHAAFRYGPYGHGDHQKQIGHQARGQYQGTQLGAVAQFQPAADKTDDQSGKQHPGIMVLWVIDPTGDEPQIQCECENNEETKDDTL